MLGRLGQAVGTKVVEKAHNELIKREIYIEPTKWNKLKLYIANSYEILLISLLFALSVYKDDAPSFIYLFTMQVLVLYSMKEEVYYLRIQRYIALAGIIALLLVAISKYVIMRQLEGILTTEECTTWYSTLRTLGFSFKTPYICVSGFAPFKSFQFEIVAIILTLFLLSYYNNQINWRQQSEFRYHYIHHSEYLKMYTYAYILFIATITVDTFFAQSFIQMVVLGFMYVLMFSWAVKNRYLNNFSNYIISYGKWIISFQLIMLALFQIYPCIQWLKGYQSAYDVMFVLGCILDLNQPTYKQLTHVFLLCYVVCSGQLYESTYKNYKAWEEKDKEGLYARHNLTEALLAKEQRDAEKIEKIDKKKLNNLTYSLKKHVSYTNLRKYIVHYLPYVSLWVNRCCSLIIAYAYHGIPAWLVLTWLLLSFILPTIPFIKWTVYLYLPTFTIAFFFEYLININGIFVNTFGPKPEYQKLFNYGRAFKFAPVEIGGMVINLIFLLIMMGTQSELSVLSKKNEFQEKIFRKLSDKNSNFLYQLFFYVLKRIHIPVLIIIFVFGLQTFNIFYIGLLFFFVMYTSSLATYRRSGSTLIFYASFFIWLQYFWSLASKYFDPSSNISKIFTMVTLQGYSVTSISSSTETVDVETGFLSYYTISIIAAVETTTSTDSSSTSTDTSSATTGSTNQNLGNLLNAYMEYSIPWSQWLILMLFVFITTVNKFFELRKVKLRSIENPNLKIDYNSVADYYEAKCDYILKIKFPKLAKILIKLQMIFSEMMILIILIVQGLILVVQQPNLMYWLFLIFSLLLQTSVVSVSEENKGNVNKCITQSQILKTYSGLVLIAQITYTFITDKQFLAQYGFDDILITILGSLNEYMSIIGFAKVGEIQSNLAKAFLSPVLFYITACILEDYFQETLSQIEEDEDNKALQGNESLVNGADQSRPHTSKNINANQTADFNKTLSIGPGAKLDDDADDLDEMHMKDQIQFNYERLKFSIPYMIYQRMGQWRFLDTIALNFHLVTAAATIFLCCNWQISLFMYFYLMCTVILCIRAAHSLHSQGKIQQNAHTENWNKSLDDDQSNLGRNNITVDYIKRDSISIDEAHRINKSYMLKANETLLNVRKGQWNFQYWLLVFSMVLMYPTPLIGKFFETHQDDSEYLEKMTNSIFWLFWTGIYVSPQQMNDFKDRAPLYLMLVLLILEKIAQRWQTNRYGCSLEKITEFKTIEEQLKLIEEGQEPLTLKQKRELQRQQEAENSQIQKDHQEHAPNQSVKPAVVARKFITIMEARQECERVEGEYREETVQVKERKLKQALEDGIKRKYIIHLRTALKFIMEQLSLQLLLFSCANKSNIVSILYLGLLLTFILIKKKTTGMLIMSYAFGTILALEYLITLTNLTVVNTPQSFPRPFEYYPCRTNTTIEVSKVSQIEIIINNQIPTFADCTNLPATLFPFPWFFGFDTLFSNLKWAMFFSIDIDVWQVNDIWFDFFNLALLTIYFFSFGNPINANNIKVSFSQTKRLEDALVEYSKIQMQKKYYAKKGEDDETKIDYDNHNNSFNSEDAADNSYEFFLGSSFYLQEVKQNIFIYYFFKKMRYFVFIGMQLVTIVMIFVLAFLCRSLMSLGYMIACVPLILHMTDFFYQDKMRQQNQKWRHPYIICGPLLVFSFVDFALQIIFQIPYFENQEYVARLFGFDRILTIDSTLSFADLVGNRYEGDGPKYLYQLNSENLYFLMLKSINLFFIFLQSRIYQSDAFWKFMRQDLRKLMSIGNHYKRMSITFRYNNWKLQKIITLQQRKKKMYEAVAELKMKVAVFQSQQKALVRGDLNPKPHQPILSQASSLKEPLLDKQEESKDSIAQDQIQTQVDSKTAAKLTSMGLPTNRLMAKLAERAQSLKISARKLQVSKTLAQRFKMGTLQDLLEHDDDYFEKKETISELKKKLGRCARFYMWLKKEHVNQIAFINDIDEGQRIKKLMEKGYRGIRNDLESCMLNDINLIYATRKAQKAKKTAIQNRLEKLQNLAKDKKETIELKDLKKTQQFLEPLNITTAAIGALFEALFSKCATLCYIAMIISQCLNAGMISILYPFAIFGYALMEEARPGQQFWVFMTYYTVFILFMKFAVQLTIFDDIGVGSTYTETNKYLLFGLNQKDGIMALFWYILPEIVILATIMGQTYYEIIIGLYDKREIEIENISQAKERFLNSFNSIQEGAAITIRKLKNQKVIQEAENVDEEGLSYESRIAAYPFELRAQKDQFYLSQKRIRDYEEFVNQKRNNLPIEVEFTQEIKQCVNLLERKHSFVDDNIIRHEKAKEIKYKRHPKKVTWVKKYFNKSPYFQRLFPTIKEQKPGIDLYARITLVQFILCYYLISYYTQMDSRGAQNLENSAQYSIYMVLMLFLQVFVMILERYISRTNTRVIKRKGPKKQIDDERYLDQMNFNDVKSMTVHLQQQKTGDTILMNLGSKDQKKVLAATHEDYLRINLEETAMTQQQVMKWLIQWALLVFYHILIFWFFPLVSNDAIYGTPDCQTSSIQIFEKFGCYSFKENGYVIVFYLLFCYYLMLSALQIRHGYPDWRTPSSLTETVAKGPFYWHLIIYNLPFLMELKIILDWCWTKTSLDVFQWLELGQIDVSMYNSRNANKVAFEKPLGEKISLTEKTICGCFCLSTILFFLVGPFLFFSNLSGFSESNLVTDAQVDLKIVINDNSSAGQSLQFEFPIFETDSPVSMKLMSYEEFVNRSYNTRPETKFFTPDQVQKIYMMTSSDSEWSISSDYKNTFNLLLKKASAKDSNVTVQLQLSYSFFRPLPSTAQQAFGTTNKTLDPTLDSASFDDFLKIANLDCGAQANKSNFNDIRIGNFVPYQLRLGEAQSVSELPFPSQNATLSYSCENYWSFNVNSEGMLFIVFSDLISSGFFSQSSLMAFYVSVAYVVGTTLRKLAMYNTDRIFICDIPNSDAIKNLIQCIYLQRLEQNLKKEEEYFWLLFEILRSPELLKALVGSSLKAELPQPKKKGEELFK